MLTCTQILRQHFGLEAYFANIRPGSRSDSCWPEHENYRWHSPNARQTTLCYLTLPSRPGPESSFLAEDTGGIYLSLDCAQAVEVELPTMTNTVKMRVRFQRAMRILDLKPSQHPSQDHGIAMSPELVNDEGADNDAEATTTPAEDSNRSQIRLIPWLAMLMTSGYYYTYSVASADVARQV